MTDRIEEEAYDYFRRIDELGGMVAAVKEGFPQREIADASFELQGEIEAGRRIVVGVNAFTEGFSDETEILRIDPELETQQVARLTELKRRRDQAAVDAVLASLQEAARAGRNLMEPLLDAARANCTEGEIIKALQVIYGTYRETPVF